MIFLKKHECDFSLWGKVVDTNTHFIKAQFRQCVSCRKVEHRFINLFHDGTSNDILANEINATLNLEEESE